MTLLIVDGHNRARSAPAQRLQRVPNVAVLTKVADMGMAVDLICEPAPDAMLLEPKPVEERSLSALTRLAGTGRPVVVITSSLVDGEAHKRTSDGAAAVLLKGTNLHHLIQTIQTTITTR